MYENPFSWFQDVQKLVKQGDLKKYEVLGLRLVLDYLESLGLDKKMAEKARESLVNAKSRPDMYVPSDEEVLATLQKLKPEHRVMMCVYLFSGIRKIEGKYLLDNFDKLRKHINKDFVKVELNTVHKTKSAYFCYMPRGLYDVILEIHTGISVRSLANSLGRHGGVSVKYARKWFFTKCISLGIPESIADFYQGRVSRTIGANHYLAKQSLADKFYTEMLLPRYVFEISRIKSH